ncbi:MAG: RHS repeat-associated core domain-containing protein [Hyphomonadaceae bacterium]|nr:RHS repeat-associated core domain-containing protein [Hyphomonadaceae bacterium]
MGEAGLYYYKARAYAPSLGRFLQSDPILHGGGMNLYAYVGDDPANARDSTGNEAWVMSRPVLGWGSHNFVVVQLVPGSTPFTFNAGPVRGYLVPGGAMGDLGTFSAFISGAPCDCAAYSLTEMGFSDLEVIFAGEITNAVFGMSDTCVDVPFGASRI